MDNQAHDDYRQSEEAAEREDAYYDHEWDEENEIERSTREKWAWFFMFVAVITFVIFCLGLIKGFEMITCINQYC